MDLITSFLMVLGFAAIHLSSRKLRGIGLIPRSAFLSFAGGISVAYVFLRILPELHEGQIYFKNSETTFLGIESIYLISLIGLVLFYALERYTKLEKSESHHNLCFWLHIVTFSLYNALIGFILHHEEESGIQAALAYFVAMGAHFLVNDIGLRMSYKKLYRTEGAWILALSIVVGWALGLFIEPSEMLIFTILAFLSGGIILNVMKEELPEERESKLLAFLLGVGVNGGILIASN